MRKSIYAIPVVVATLVWATVAQAFPYDKFERATLSEITARWERGIAAEPIPGAKKQIVIEGPVLRQVVRANYSGQHRKVDAETAEFILDYEKAHHIENTLARLYQEKYLFIDSGKDYWLPAQAPVAEYFAAEVKLGVAIDLYIIAAGGFVKSETNKWVLTVEEFKTIEP